MTSSAKAPATRAGICRDVPCERAEDMIDVLRPLKEPWVTDRRSWIFRGQADADWTLRPKAIHTPSAFAAHGVDGDPSTWAQRRTMLDRMLERFRARLDHAGARIPVEVWRSPRVIKTSTNAEPERPEFPIMALAQHHGLPTPLLDWSRRGHVAAYFAAKDAARLHKDERPSHLAVYALRVPQVVREGRLHPALEVYEAPTETNPNLHAQSGLFTLLIGDAFETVEAYVASVPSVDGAPPIVRLERVMLPGHEAPKLLRLLSYEGIDAATMYPGADGVARAMRELAHWDIREGE